MTTNTETPRTKAPKATNHMRSDPEHPLHGWWLEGFSADGAEAKGTPWPIPLSHPVFDPERNHVSLLGILANLHPSSEGPVDAALAVYAEHTAREQGDEDAYDRQRRRRAEAFVRWFPMGEHYAGMGHFSFEREILFRFQLDDGISAHARPAVNIWVNNRRQILGAVLLPEGAREIRIHPPLRGCATPVQVDEIAISGAH